MPQKKSVTICNVDYYTLVLNSSREQCLHDTYLQYWSQKTFGANTKIPLNIFRPDYHRRDPHLQKLCSRSVEHCFHHRQDYAIYQGVFQTNSIGDNTRDESVWPIEPFEVLRELYLRPSESFDDEYAKFRLEEDFNNFRSFNQNIH